MSAIMAAIISAAAADRHHPNGLKSRRAGSTAESISPPASLARRSPLFWLRGAPVASSTNAVVKVLALAWDANQRSRSRHRQRCSAGDCERARGGQRCLVSDSRARRPSCRKQMVAAPLHSAPGYWPSPRGRDSLS